MKEQDNNVNNAVSETYESPRLTVVTFKVEQGYTGSLSLAMGSDNIAYGDHEIEERQDGGYWGGSSDWF